VFREVAPPAGSRAPGTGDLPAASAAAGEAEAFGAGGWGERGAEAAHAPVMLKVRALGARRLKAMDRNGFSDPYLTLQVGCYIHGLRDSRVLV